MTTTNTYGRQVVVPLTNKSGGGVIAGDVVIVGTANNDAFTTTASAAFTGVVGIAQETIADNATGRVLLSGYAALVNTTASVTRQNFGTTSTTVKKAVDAGSSRIAGTFCLFLTGGTTPDAIVWQPDLATTGLADPMTTRGDVIVRNASNVTARLAIGSTGKVLSSDGTDVSWQTPGSGGSLVLLEQHTASGSATLDFTTFISSTYDEYLLEGVNVAPATNGATLNCVVGTGGGPTYDTTANYFTAGNTSAFPFATTVANNAGYGQASFTARLLNPQSATQMKQVLGLATWHNGANVVMPTGIGGLYAQTTVLTALRFSFSSGNIASGTIRAYGIAK